MTTTSQGIGCSGCHSERVRRSCKRAHGEALRRTRSSAPKSRLRRAAKQRCGGLLAEAWGPTSSPHADAGSSAPFCRLTRVRPAPKGFLRGGSRPTIASRTARRRCCTPGCRRSGRVDAAAKATTGFAGRPLRARRSIEETKSAPEAPVSARGDEVGPRAAANKPPQERFSGARNGVSLRNQSSAQTPRSLRARQRRARCAPSWMYSLRGDWRPIAVTAAPSAVAPARTSARCTSTPRPASRPYRPPRPRRPRC
jgi:hypothetical protein